jgi:hypothetical protein
VLAASIIRVVTLMMKAASTSEMSINFYQTASRNNPEDSHIHTSCCENLKSLPHLFLEKCFFHIHSHAFKRWNKVVLKVLHLSFAFIVSSRKIGLTVPADETALHTVQFCGCKGISVSVWGVFNATYMHIFFSDLPI